ncbi:MAG TPA: HAD family hydrolase, partial [Solirubrobacteraceae bacterium]
MRPASPPDARLVVLDLDGTLARLDVDWDGVRARLARLALRDDSAARPDRVSHLLARASVPTRAAMLEVLADAEERAAGRAPLNRALLDWLGAPAGARRGPRHGAAGGVTRDGVAAPVAAARAAALAPVAILTLNSERAAARVAERAGLAARLVGVVGRESAAAPKPDPAGLHALAA